MKNIICFKAYYIRGRLGEELDENVARFDGLNMVFGDLRLNLGSSNTEPVICLNLETKGRKDLLAKKLAEVQSIIMHFSDSK